MQKKICSKFKFVNAFENEFELKKKSISPLPLTLGLQAQPAQRLPPPSLPLVADGWGPPVSSFFPQPLPPSLSRWKPQPALTPAPHDPSLPRTSLSFERQKPEPQPPPPPLPVRPFIALALKCIEKSTTNNAAGALQLAGHCPADSSLLRLRSSPW